MDDGTRFYVDAGSGQIVATRTRWWRFYDFMWGLHIMDPKPARTRTTRSYPVRLVALAMSVLGADPAPQGAARRSAKKTRPLDLD